MMGIHFHGLNFAFLGGLVFVRNVCLNESQKHPYINHPQKYGSPPNVKVVPTPLNGVYNEV